MTSQPKESDEQEDLLRDKTFLRYFKTLPEKPATTVRIFERNHVYTVHGCDALFVAKEYFKTESVVKTYGSGGDTLDCVWLNKIKFEGLARHILLVKQYRLEVYKTKSTYKIMSTDWTLHSKASPGNLSQLEDVLFGQLGQSAHAGVAAIKIASDRHKVVGVAYADVSSASLRISEFTDSDHLNNLEAVLVHLDPKEIIITPGDHQSDKSLKQILERSSALVTEVKKASFNSKDITQDLGRLLKKKENSETNINVLPELEKTHAISGLAAVIRYLELTSREDLFNTFTLSSFDLGHYLRLDTAAVRALNLMPAPLEGGNKFQSVFGLLNHCRTTQGQRLLSQWIKQPLLDLNKIEERLDLVEVFVQNAELRQSLRDEHLTRIPDYQRLAKRFHTSKANLQDCYRIYQSLEKLPVLSDLLHQFDGPHAALLKSTFYEPLADLIMDFGKFQEMIESTLDFTKVDEHEFMVKADFDDDLAEMRKRMDTVESEIKAQLNVVVRDLGTDSKTVKLESNTQLGYYFRITRKDEKLLRNSRNYRTIDTNKNGVRFRNTRLTQLNTEYVQVKEEYNKQQASVVSEILIIAAGYTEPLLHLNDFTSQLDVIVSLAQASVSAPTQYVRPKLHPLGSGILKLSGARHPCVEMQDDMAFIPNDVFFDKDNFMFHIITGPNMGGKSTFIRSVGVIVLLAQVGCFVPCDEAEITIVDSILVRVGAGDNQLKGISTFMAEMLDTANILSTATDKSLVIIDELGRGTSTYDGFGLAWAIAEHIAVTIKPFSLFATHYHEMTQLADTVETVNNLHVTALTSNDALTLLYKVNPGPCDQSFGIHVAELAHFPSHIVQTARDKVRLLEDYQSVSLHGTDFEGDSEMAVKKRKLEKASGEKLIEDFLSKVKALDPTKLSDVEFQNEVESLKQQIVNEGNLYVQDVVARLT